MLACIGDAWSPLGPGSRFREVAVSGFILTREPLPLLLILCARCAEARGVLAMAAFRSSKGPPRVLGVGSHPVDLVFLAAGLGLFVLNGKLLALAFLINGLAWLAGAAGGGAFLMTTLGPFYPFGPGPVYGYSTV